MATKPTDRILDWASGGTTTDPGAGQEATGWVVDDRPPANWWNWILNSFGQWLTWAETSIDAIETKTDFITITEAANLDWGVPHAIANYRTSGVEAGGTTLWSKNVSSMAVSSSGVGFVSLTLSTALAATTDAVIFVLNRDSVGDYHFNAAPVSTTVIEVYINDYDGVAVDPTVTANINMSVIVFGDSA